MHKPITLLLFLTIILSGCKSATEPPPPEENPPGYQEDIPWPSLADSPWPIGRYSPQATGRSSLEGPNMGEYSIFVDSMYITSGLTLGNDTTVYFLSAYNGHHGLYALSLSGDILWKITDINEIPIFAWSTPAVASDGTIYFITYSMLVAVDDQGNIKWTFGLNNSSSYDIAIDLDGNIYCLTKSSTIYSISKEGKLNWELTDDRFHNGGWISAMCFSPDGNTVYIHGITPTLLAVDIVSRKVKWTFGDSPLQGFPLIDSEGHIYVQAKSNELNAGKPALYSLNDDGSVRWVFSHNNSKIGTWTEEYTSGAMDKNGNYYFASDTLYSIDYNGNLRWKTPLNSTTSVPLTVDNLGNVFVVSEYENKLFSYDSKGGINFVKNLDGMFLPLGQPIIIPNQQILLPNFKGSKIFLIK